MSKLEKSRIPDRLNQSQMEELNGDFRFLNILKVVVIINETIKRAVLNEQEKHASNGKKVKVGEVLTKLKVSGKKIFKAEEIQQVLDLQNNLREEQTKIQNAFEGTALDLTIDKNWKNDLYHGLERRKGTVENRVSAEKISDKPVDVLIFLDKLASRAKLINISSTGLRFKTNTSSMPITTKDQIKLQFTLHEESYEVKGIVQNNKEDEYGIRFIDLNEETRKKLNLFLGSMKL